MVIKNPPVGTEIDGLQPVTSSPIGWENSFIFVIQSSSDILNPGVK